MARSPRRNHLRLVEPVAPSDIPVLTDPAAQREFAQLTELLVEYSIEITELVDGDPDVEPNGDECEDSDPPEDDDGI